jgi:hypothetical protein
MNAHNDNAGTSCGIAPYGVLGLSLLLAGCLATTQMQVWRKPGISPEQDRRDHIDCGAVPEGPNRVTVHEKVQREFDRCMAGKGYISETVTPTSSQWRVGRPSASTDDPDVRRSLARNAPNVSVDPSCVGLFVPKVEQEMFRNALPAWYLYVLNNSQNRYSVQYDLQVRERGSTYFGAYDETGAQERALVSRPNEFSKFVVIQGKQGLEVVSVNVFRCSPDGRLAPASTPGAIAPVAAEPRPSSANRAAPQRADVIAGAELVRAIQQELIRKTFLAGRADGVLGARTREAITRYQRQVGLSPDGQPSLSLLDRLRAP